MIGLICTLCAQVVSFIIVSLSNFIILLYALRYFAFNETLFYGWLECLGWSFLLGFGVIDIIVIVFRNNMDWTRRILKTRQYQVIEKFAVSPVRSLISFLHHVLLKVLC